MKERKKETFIYEDLGFPVKLINAPMKKVFGQWFLDINLTQLQKTILHLLIHKPSPLTGEEIRFIRKFLEMTTSEFGSYFGATHAAVLKWEKNESQMNPTTDFCIRMYLLKRLRAKAKEFSKTYDEIFHEIVTSHKNKEAQLKVKGNKITVYPFELDADTELLACS